MNDRHRRVKCERPWQRAEELVKEGFHKGMNLTLPEVTKAVAMLSKPNQIKQHESDRGELNEQ